MKFLKLFIKQSIIYPEQLSITSESGSIRKDLTDSDFKVGEEVYLVDKKNF